MEEYFDKTYTQIREELREMTRRELTMQKMQQELMKDVNITVKPGQKKQRLP